MEYRIKDKSETQGDDLIIVEDGDDAKLVKENALKSQLERLIPFPLLFQND